MSDRQFRHHRTRCFCALGTISLLALCLDATLRAAEKQSGHHIETDRSRGERYEGTYRDGLREGTWKLYGARMKTIHEESFLRGVRDGPFVAYSVDGRIVSLVNYRDGKRHGTARFHFGDGRSLLAIYRRGEETSRRLLGTAGQLLRTLSVRTTHPIVSSDNWDGFWDRMDGKVPRTYRENPGGWSLRVVISSFRDKRRYLNPHLLSDVEGELFRDLLSRFSHNVCRSAGKAWATVLSELGGDLTEKERDSLQELFCEFHDRLSSFDDALWDEERAYHVGLYHEFLDALEKKLSNENFALLAIFLESVNLTTRPAKSVAEK